MGETFLRCSRHEIRFLNNQLHHYNSGMLVSFWQPRIGYKDDVASTGCHTVFADSTEVVVRRRTLLQPIPNPRLEIQCAISGVDMPTSSVSAIVVIKQFQTSCRGTVSRLDFASARTNHATVRFRQFFLQNVQSKVQTRVSVTICDDHWELRNCRPGFASKINLYMHWRAGKVWLTAPMCRMVLTMNSDCVPITSFAGRRRYICVSKSSKLWSRTAWMSCLFSSPLSYCVSRWSCGSRCCCGPPVSYLQMCQYPWMQHIKFESALAFSLWLWPRQSAIRSCFFAKKRE